MTKITILRNFLVGFLFLGSLVILGVVTLRVSDLSWLHGAVHELQVRFPTVDQLAEGHPVRVGGVRVGQVEGIEWSPQENPQNPVLVRLGGTMDRVNAGALARKIVDYLKRQGGELLLNLDGLIAIEDGALIRLLRKIRKFDGRVKVLVSEKAKVLSEAITGMPESLTCLFVRSRPATS